MTVEELIRELSTKPELYEVMISEDGFRGEKIEKVVTDPTSKTVDIIYEGDK